MPFRHPSWVSQQTKLCIKRGILGYLKTIPVVRHIRWIIYFVKYYKWWVKRGYKDNSYFHHDEDTKFLNSIWKGLR